ncbi:YegJ family protein [Foetidibacter luteolus]|uniref:YegJ family protein n=1 Tax=Foetidibacter luteolus TaxID=2608880 RepID=UPI00129A8A3A|nr:DUF2314 domain-containing protein [Foetidibacter luteolus]
MKQYLLKLIILIGLVSCNNNQTTKIERDGEPEIYGVTDTDAEMNGAIKTANQTLAKFNEALKSGNPNFEYFALKTRFNTPDGAEHIWVSNITIKDNKYFGVVDNLPESTTAVKLGDTIQIKDDNISDWMYIDNQRLRGGYTIRVLRNRMTEQERKQFDEENGLIIEN